MFKRKFRRYKKSHTKVLNAVFCYKLDHLTQYPLISVYVLDAHLLACLLTDFLLMRKQDKT